MLITGQNVPPELLNLYNSLVSTKTTGTQAGTVASTAKAVKKSTKKIRNPDDQWQAVAEAVYAEFQDIPGIAPKDTFISEERNRLVNGIFDEKYWVRATRTSSQYLTSVPANASDPTPPPYAYRTPEMLPSIVTYPNGEESSGPMATQGHVEEKLWIEGAWTWRKSVWQLLTRVEPNSKLPIVWTSLGRLTVNTEQRGSRPLFSLVMKSWLSDAENPISDTTEPPDHPHTSIYWQYEVPDWTGETYNKSIDRSPAFVLNNRAYDLNPGTTEKVTILTAARPMFGRGWNNNTTASSIYQDAETVWELRDKLADAEPSDGTFGIFVYRGIDAADQPETWSEPQESVWPYRQIAKYTNMLIPQLRKPNIFKNVEYPAMLLMAGQWYDPGDQWIFLRKSGFQTTITPNAGTIFINTVPTITAVSMEIPTALPALSLTFKYP